MTERKPGIQVTMSGLDLIKSLREDHWRSINGALDALVGFHRVENEISGKYDVLFSLLDATRDMIGLLACRFDPKSETTFREIVLVFLDELDTMDLDKSDESDEPNESEEPNECCQACSIEAEIGSEENPHPVPKRFHICTEAAS